MGVNIMKKCFYMLVFASLLVGMASCGHSELNNSSSSTEPLTTSTITKLSTPKNINFENNKIVWDAVEGAEYYKIEIEANGAINYYSKSINNYNVSFDADTDFYYRVMAVAENELNNSNWSVKLFGRYVTSFEYDYFNQDFAKKGLTKTVNLISPTGSYTSVETGALRIFDDNKLSKLKVNTTDIKYGDQKETICNSYEEINDEYIRDIDSKFSFSKIKPGQKKVVSQKSLGIEIKYSNQYQRLSKSETKINIKRLSNYYQYQEYSFDEYGNIQQFKDCVTNTFLENARTLQNDLTDANINEFIKKYGTHFITSSIYGAKMDMSYSLVGTQESVDEKIENEAMIKFFRSINYKEVGFNGSVSIDDNMFKSSQTLNINTSISFYGGTNQGMTFDENSMSSFSEEYKSWAKSANDVDNMRMIDVGNGSLYSVWELLDDDEFSTLKTKLDEYFALKASENYNEYMNKVNSLFLEEDHTNFAGGDGSLTNPFLIATSAHLVNMEKNLSAHYKLVEDIDLTTIFDWTPIGTTSTESSFKGSLDGNGKTIKISRTKKFYAGINFGIFGIVEDASISNLNIDAKISYGDGSDRLNQNDERIYIGALAGIAKGKTQIINCKISGEIQEIYSTKSAFLVMGGLVGKAIDNVTIRNCSNAAKVYGQALYVRTGGIAGRVDDYGVTIDSCHNQGYIRAGGSGTSGNGYAGSIIGAQYEYASITNCTNSSSDLYSSGKTHNHGNPSGNIFTDKSGQEFSDDK